MLRKIWNLGMQLKMKYTLIMKIVVYIIICFGTKAPGLFEFCPSYNLNSVIWIIRIVKKSGILVILIVFWEVALKCIDFCGRQSFLFVLSLDHK